MAQVSSGVISAGVAGTTFVDGVGIEFVLAIPYLDDPKSGEQMTVTGIARGHHTIEHVYATPDRLD
jgi:hypothetical protein